MYDFFSLSFSSIFKYLEDKFKEFLDENKDNLEKCEYLIPEVVCNNIKKNKMSNTKYKDIVILLRSIKDKGTILEETLKKYNIPVFCDVSTNLFDSDEIHLLISLLKIIDNSLQEIPLVATMRSTIGGFTDNELVEIRLSDKYDNFYNTLLKSKKDVSEQLINKINKFLEQIEI